MKCDYCNTDYSTINDGTLAVTFGCAFVRKHNHGLELENIIHNDDHAAFIAISLVTNDGHHHLSGKTFYRLSTSQCDACFCSRECARKWWANIFEQSINSFGMCAEEL